MTLDEKIKKLEKGCTVPGTVIQRVIMDRGMMLRHKLKVLVDRTYDIVWSVGLGELNGPKAFGFGHTIRSALCQAEKKFKADQTKKKSR